MSAGAQFATDARLDVIRYSQVWEDPRLLARGLQIGAGDDVLSIAGAGDNVLALLLAGARSVVAVDVSEAQLALLELKLAALARLAHDEFAVLLGARAGGDRERLYRRVRDGLGERSRAFWDEHAEVLEQGVLGSGMLERYLEAFRARHVPAQAAELLDLDDRERQAALFERHLATPEFTSAVRATFTAEAMSGRARDATQFRYVEVDDAPGLFLARLRHVCTRLPTRGNFYLEWFLTGRYCDLDCGPPFLRPGNFARLRALAGRVTLVHADVAHVLRGRPAGAFSAANLSDLLEYLAPDAARDLLELAGARLRAGGRVAYWNLLVPRSLPDGGAGGLTARRERARRLWEQDRVFFYRDFHLDLKEPAAA